MIAGSANKVRPGRQDLRGTVNLRDSGIFALVWLHRLVRSCPDFKREFKGKTIEKDIRRQFELRGHGEFHPLTL
jgi:hypothetical protein